MKYSVLFQLDQANLQAASRLINQTRNAAKDIPDLQVEWVIHGKAVLFLCSEEVALSNPENRDHVMIKPQLLALMEELDLTILACHNALISQQIERKHLLQPVEVVPSGVGHIIRRQAEGWSYIKIT